MKRTFILAIIFIFMFNCLTVYASYDGQDDNQIVIISAVGDCTLGCQYNDRSSYSFDSEFAKQKNYNYFFENVESVFKNDDLTLANLETNFTTVKKPVLKEFNFRGSYDYVNIIKVSGIDAVNISNNHIHDFGTQGFNDTIMCLKNNNISFYGEGYRCIKKVKGINIGILGYRGWSSSSYLKKTIRSDILKFKKTCSFVVISFHWGAEGAYYPNSVQKNLAHFSIDSGADLVIGHHPHVLEGIENYKGSYIAYSLGNFCYGGSKYVKDKDTIIFQQKLVFNSKKQLIEKSINIIPCSISSVNYRNNYQPVILNGADKKRVENRIKTYSKKL